MKKRLLKFRRESDKLFFMFSRKSRSYYKLNKTAYIILSLYNEGLSTGEIVERLVTDFDLIAEIAEDFVKSCLTMLADEKSSHLGTSLRSPIRMTWRITNRCNLMCKHCYFESNEKNYNELDTEQCTQVIWKAHEAGILNIHLSGGEPLFRKDIEKIIHQIDKHDFGLSIFTNGTLISKKMNELKEYEVTWMVSLDGLEKEHDSLRGKGTFKKTVKGIELLKKYDKQICVHTTISSLNYRNIVNFIDYVMNLVGNLDVNCTLPYGRALKNVDMLLSVDQYSNTLSRIREYYKEMGYPIATIDISNPSQPKIIHITKNGFTKATIDMWRCNAGNTRIEIYPDGSVYTCPFLAEPRFSLGNILTDTVEDMWLSEGRKHFLEYVKDSSSFFCKPAKQLIAKYAEVE